MGDTWALGKALWDLERCGCLLDDLLFPRQPSSGENAGKPPKGGKSRPPLQISMVDLKAQTESVLCAWSARAASALSVPVPASRLIGVRAAWLQTHLADLGEMPWLDMAVEQIVAQARLVLDVVEPADGDPVDPIEVGGPAEVASWARHLGAKVSRATVYRWAQRGVIASQLMSDGRLVVRLDEVMKTAGDQRNDGHETQAL